VTSPLSITRRFGVWLGLLLLCLVTFDAAGAGTKRVLIVNSFGSASPPFTTHSTAFETELTEKAGERIDLDEISLDVARYEDPAMKEALVEYIRKRQAKWQPDLVVPIGSPACVFIAQNRERLFPETPILYAGTDKRRLPEGALQKNATLVGEDFNLPGFVEDILQVAPATTNIAVVIGASPLEQYWASVFRQAFEPFTNRVSFTWLNDLPFDQMLERVSKLPPRSFIFLVLLHQDAAGVTLNADEALMRIHAVANAPVNGIFIEQLGLGIVGGRLYQAAQEGVESADMAIRILHGEPASSIPPKIVGPLSPRYDWRELQRWGISEANLPAGSVIKFRQPGFWELYWRPITGIVLFCILQSILIVALLANRARRLQGEAAASLIADISSKFVNLPAIEVDAAIKDAQRRIFELLDLDVSGFWEWSEKEWGFFRITHFSRPGLDLQIPERMNAQEYLPWYQMQMLAGRTIAVSSMNELPSAAARDRETFRQFGFRSNLTIPLSVGGAPPVGAMGFNTTRMEREWPDALVKRLQLVAEIFANALARKQADENLRESERRFSLVSNTAPVLIWAAGPDKLCNFFNQPWLDFTGRTLEQELGNGWVAGVHPDDLKTCMSIYNEFFDARRPFNMEYRLRRHDGQYRWIADHGVPRFDGQGNFFGYIGSCVDVTERKQTEAAMHDLNRRLIHAQEAERARLGRELHDDVTQRLAILAIEAGRVERGAKDVSPSDAMRSVREGLVRLSEDIHALSYRLHPALLEDLGLAEALKAECERFSRQEKISVDVKFDPLLPVIPPETALCLFRVTQEALRNVSRHAKARKVKVSLRVLDGGLQLAVSDDGAGFVPSLQREKPSLGLASMRERVRLLEGELEIESAPGQGTTIMVWVPLKKAEG
jgi:PAS domain S-box-containing protein